MINKNPGDSFRSSAVVVAGSKDALALGPRDELAALALDGLLSQQTNGLISHIKDLDKRLPYLGNRTIPESYAHISYKFADAMIAERGKRGKGGKGKEKSADKS